jgi:TATA-box binding protein (TBP) (component of TFIID and TFIIIB)
MLHDFFIQVILEIDRINIGMVGLHEAASREQEVIFEPEQTPGLLARLVNPNPKQ